MSKEQTIPCPNCGGLGGYLGAHLGWAPCHDCGGEGLTPTVRERHGAWWAWDGRDWDGPFVNERAAASARRALVETTFFDVGGEG